MAPVSGFTDSFTSGEICDDAWDRVDIQPIVKGCEVAQNFVVRIAGPLGKRRGFWLNGTVNDQTRVARLIPFRKSVTDAFMLELGDGVGRVWQTNGQPFLNGGVQVSFSHPFTAAQLAGLRYKQVADVIYFRHNTGLQPWALTRSSNTSWAGAYETFPNGPWLNENTDTASTITVGYLSGPSLVLDANTQTNAGYVPVGSTVSLNSSANLFNANQVGSYVRLRQTPGEGAGVYSWAAGQMRPVGWFCLSVGNVYVCTATQGNGQNNSCTNPPVHTSGVQSDGASSWEFVGDGAGIVQITSVTGPTSATGVVTAAIPYSGATATTCYWAFSAYSNDRGWPRMWPSLREERLVNGATDQNRDTIDLTETAGFYPTKESYHPGLGTGNVSATDAIRRRVGDDCGELIWSTVATYLVCGSVSGEYLVAGSVLDEPLSPSAVTIKQLSAFGSADVFPARAHKGILYVTRAGAVLRELIVDTSQQASTDDLTVLARHIADRGFAQLAWTMSPDETLWCRLNDGGLAAFVYHQEQQVRGWCSVALPTGWICEDVATLPGPGGFETLWCVWSRTKGGATQRVIVMQSQPSDNLFMDLAQSYSGGATSALSGLTLFEGETMTAVANGAWQSDAVVSNSGTLAVPPGTTSAQVGFRQQAFFRSLKLDVASAGGTMGKVQRPVGAIVSVKTAQCSVGIDGGESEILSTRTQADIPNTAPKRWIKEVTFAGDGAQDGRDPRITIEDDTPFDCVIYSIRPKVAVGG